MPIEIVIVIAKHTLHVFARIGPSQLAAKALGFTGADNRYEADGAAALILAEALPLFLTLTLDEFVGLAAELFPEFETVGVAVEFVMQRLRELVQGRLVRHRQQRTPDLDQIAHQQIYHRISAEIQAEINVTGTFILK